VWVLTRPESVWLSSRASQISFPPGEEHRWEEFGLRPRWSPSARNLENNKNILPSVKSSFVNPNLPGSGTYDLSDPDPCAAGCFVFYCAAMIDKWPSRNCCMVRRKGNKEHGTRNLVGVLSLQSDYRCHNFAQRTACWAWWPRRVPTQPYILEGTSNFQGTSDFWSKKAYFFRLIGT
jgi:hypothetical protein